LSDDVIEEILKYSSSYSTLLSTILVAKPISRVYQTHPKSILYSLYYHVLGPTFPQALELYRRRVCLEQMDDHALFPNVLNDPPIIMTAYERRSIQHTEGIVTELENLFSFRHVDRTSVVSQLDSQESCRFRRAVYRIMLYNCEFHLN
ncbi:hypothetical protein BT96DRAFT_758203, partial [Gymnopus androsaceus JB14]